MTVGSDITAVKLILRPLFFIAMPFGRKGAGGLNVEFDAVWWNTKGPAIEAVGMQPSGTDSAL
jgi:hypothetical protein